MKRWLSIALVALFTLTSGLGALAEAEETVFSEAVDASVALASGEDGELELDIGEWMVETEDEPAEAQAAAKSVAAYDYGMVLTADTPVYASASGDAEVTRLADGSVVLLAEEGSRPKVAFYTRSGIVTGYMDDANLRRLSEKETDAFMDAAAKADDLALYNGNIDAPLMLLDCDIEQDVEPEATEAPEFGIALTEEELELTVGETRRLSARNESGALIDSAELTFRSTDDAVVSVTEDGTVSALQAGSAQILVSYYGETASCAVTVHAEAAGVRLSDNSVEIGVKEVYEGLSATVIGAEGEVAKISWTTDNAKIVKVDAKTGVLTGVKAGSAYVYAVSGGKEAKCKVTVKKAPSKIEIAQDELELAAGGMTAQLEISLSSGSASGKITYKSSKKSVATVDASGVVTAVAEGKATITAETFNGKTATCAVNVYGAPVMAVMDVEKLSLAAGQKTTLNATALTKKGAETPAAFTYTVDPASADPACVSVDEETGEVLALHRGQTVVRALAHNGIEARCAVTVAAAPADIRIEPASDTIGVKEIYEGLVAVLIAPEGEEDCAAAITWRSGNSKIASVNAETGAVTGVKAGTAYVYARTHNGKEAKCKITVMKAPSKVTMASGEVDLTVGMSWQLETALPKGTASGEITYASGNEEVVTVGADGMLTAVAPGTAEVVASTFNGKEAKCKVTVYGAPVSLELDATRLPLAGEESFTLTATARDSADNEVPAGVRFYVDAASQDPACLSVDEKSGEVLGLHRGTATVVAESYNGLRDVCVFDVVPAPKSISLNISSGTMGVKETYTGLEAELIAPDGEPDCAANITWRSSNSKIVKVDSFTGAVTAVKAGTAYVYARTHNGKEAKCKVTVKKAPSKVTISPAVASLSVGDSGEYKVKLSAGSAGGVTFTSSKPEIATVNDDGEVTALAAGTVTITVKTYNGKTAKSKLTIKGDAGDAPTGQGKPTASDVTQYSDDLSNADKIEYLIHVAQSRLGKPYVYGGFGPDKFDCSGFTYYCFKQIGITLKDSAYKQGYDSKYEKLMTFAELKRGDVVVFNTVSDSDLSDHTGIYLGNGYFIHASSSAKKVVVSQFKTSSSNYYERVFSWGMRILDT